MAARLPSPVRPSSLHGLAPAAPVAAPSAAALEAGLFVLLSLSVLPFAVCLVMPERAPWLPLGGLADSRVFRQASGFLALGIVAFQLLHASRRRSARPARLERFWHRQHRLNALPLALVVLLHTGGRWGVGLNGLLLASLLGLLLVAQGGHVWKAWAAARARPEARPGVRALGRDASLNGSEGRLHRAGLQLHVVLATAVAILLAAHVLGVYYF